MIVSLPGRVPLAIGVNVTFIVQLVPAATLVPQLLVWVYSFPLGTMLDNASAFVPILVRVMLFGALLVLVVCAAKAKLTVESRTDVEGTTRDAVTVRVLFPALAITVMG